MRPNEPLNLLVEDVDLATGDIFIRKSKRGKDRHIIVSEDMRLLCAKYDQLAVENANGFSSTGKVENFPYIGQEIS